MWVRDLKKSLVGRCQEGHEVMVSESSSPLVKEPFHCELLSLFVCVFNNSHNNGCHKGQPWGSCWVNAFSKGWRRKYVDEIVVDPNTVWLAKAAEPCEKLQMDFISSGFPDKDKNGS